MFCLQFNPSKGRCRRTVPADVRRTWSNGASVQFSPAGVLKRITQIITTTMYSGILLLLQLLLLLLLLLLLQLLLLLRLLVFRE